MGRTCKMILSRAALPFILTLDEILFAPMEDFGQSGFALRLPEVRLRATFAAEPCVLSASADAPFQIRSAREKCKRGQSKLSPSHFRAEWI